MSEKSFDSKSSTQGRPINDGPVESELAGASRERKETDPPDLSKAVPVYPVQFDRDSGKDFRPQEVVESASTPKGSVLEPVSERKSLSTSPTGLEDVSQEDQQPIPETPPSVPTSAETAS